MKILFFKQLSKAPSLLVYSFVLFVLLIGCSEDEPVVIVPEVLIDQELIVTKTRDEIVAFVKSNGLPFSESDLKYDVEVYSITYKSTFQGSEIIASGLVILPQTSDQLSMLSFQHGTIASNAEAPTQTPVTSSTMSFYAAMASPGFVGVVPDLFGFGSSSDILHPYYIETATATAVIDNLKAARELALVNNLNFSGRLFLAGYSQGGYATMAAHKSIELNPLEDFDLVASFPASGGYDIKGVQEYFFEQTTYDQPFYLAYVALAYKTYLGWSQSLTDFFQEPYASAIPGLINGTNTGSQINAGLTDNVSDLVNPTLLSGIDTDPQFSYIVDAFNDNSVNDFTPKIKIYMYHGDLDTTVPYQNSVDVFNQFIAEGASPEVVKFTTLPFATHSTGVVPYLIDFVDKLLKLK